VLDHSKIRAILPHGHPMVLVDQVISLKLGASIIGIKAITGSEPCYHSLPQGLGPERYAYPISLLVESFGQTAAILWLESIKSFNQDLDRVLMFTSVRNLRIEGQAFPGNILRHVVRLDNIVGDNVFVEGETWVEDRQIAIIESMIAAVRPRSVVIEYATPSGAGMPRDLDDTATDMRFLSSRQWLARSENSPSPRASRKEEKSSST
jgi:3-hydroxyacyl-[acyl-carrier-protein] dehydratase